MACGCGKKISSTTSNSATFSDTDIVVATVQTDNIGYIIKGYQVLKDSTPIGEFVDLVEAKVFARKNLAIVNTIYGEPE